MNGFHIFSDALQNGLVSIQALQGKHTKGLSESLGSAKQELGKRVPACQATQSSFEAPCPWQMCKAAAGYPH